MICGSIFGDSWGALGGTGNPQDGLRMPPQRLMEDLLVTKKMAWATRAGFFEEKTHIFKPFGKTQMWLKHSKYCSLLTVRILNFRGLQDSILEAILGPFWHHFAII